MTCPSCPAHKNNSTVPIRFLFVLSTSMDDLDLSWPYKHFLKGKGVRKVFSRYSIYAGSISSHSVILALYSRSREDRQTELCQASRWFMPTACKGNTYIKRGSVGYCECCPILKLPTHQFGFHIQGYQAAQYELNVVHHHLQSGEQRTAVTDFKLF